MIKLKIFMFLLGFVIVSTRVIKPSTYGANTIVFGKPRNRHLSEMTPSHNSIFQQGTNLFYKPKFMTPSAYEYIPTSLVSGKAQKPDFLPYALQNTPGIIMAQPIEINTLPESRIFSDINCEEHETALIPEEINIQPLPEFAHFTLEESFKPETSIVEVMPEAPVLPSFVMPELPKIEEHVVPIVSETPCEHEETKLFDLATAPVLPPLHDFFPITISETYEPAPMVIEEIVPHIPEAPVLPSFVMPEIPKIEEHVVPIVPETPCEYEHTNVFVDLPAAPELPTLHDFFPITISEPAPMVIEEVIPHIPEAPVLPSFVMPELPKIVEHVVPIVPELPCEHEDSKSFVDLPAAPELPTLHEIGPIFISEAFEPAPMVIEEVIPHIPEAPVLPSFVMPELPNIVEHVVPTMPETPCEYEHTNVFVDLPAASELPTLHDFFPITISEPAPMVIEEVIPHIPEAPVLPSFVMPELPKIVEHVVPIVPELPCEHEDSKSFVDLPAAPELPTLHEIGPIFISEAFEPAPMVIEEVIPHIPEAPVLPSFVMPELPNIVEHVVPTMPETPCEYEHTNVFVDLPAASELPTLHDFFPITISEQAPMVIEEVIPHIPEAPVLPSFVMPELPKIVEHVVPIVPELPCEHEDSKSFVDLPAAPELPTLHEIGPIFISEAFEPATMVIEEVIPHIPEAPVLPSFVMPELPNIVEHVVPTMPETPCEHENSKLFVDLPAAPELPTLHDFFPITISEPAPMVIEEVIPHIPEAPVLPSFVMPELSKIVEHVAPIVPELPCEHEDSKSFVNLPAAPELPMLHDFFPITISEPAPIVIEEVIPHIPEAPVLPSFVMPELPVLPSFVIPKLTSLETLNSEPELNTIDNHAPEEYLELLKIPKVPVLPTLSFFVPKIQEIETSKVLPEPTLVEVHSEQNCEQTEFIEPIEIIKKEKPIINTPKHHSGYFPFAVFNAQNIIIERVVPNMIFNSEKIPVNTMPFFTNQFVEESLRDCD